MVGTRQAGGAGRDATERREALDERRRRSVEEPLDVRLRVGETYPILSVRNPLHGTEYLVLWPTYPSPEVTLCTCTDYARRGLGRCKHIEAALRWMESHPGERLVGPRGTRWTARPGPGLWKRVDRAIKDRAKDPSPASLAVRKPGRLLFERPAR